MDMIKECRERRGNNYDYYVRISIFSQDLEYLALIRRQTSSMSSYVKSNKAWPNAGLLMGVHLLSHDTIASNKDYYTPDEFWLS